MFYLHWVDKKATTGQTTNTNMLFAQTIQTTQWPDTCWTFITAQHMEQTTYRTRYNMETGLKNLNNVTPSGFINLTPQNPPVFNNNLDFTVF